tara:strand:- start:1965 stop:2726 length:762 start_codon:yes stop_codon:yes gene_type:complete
VLVGVGYGTPKWDCFVERSPDEVSQAIDYLLENEALITVKDTATGVEAEGSGEETGGTQPTEEIEKDGPTSEESATSADEIGEDEQDLDDDDLGLEDEPAAPDKASSVVAIQPEIQALMEALGKERWEKLLTDPEGAVAMLEQGGRSRPSSEDEESESEDEDARALKFLEEKHSELEEELESVKQRFEEAKKDARDLQGQLDDEKRQTKTLEDQIRRAEEAKGIRVLTGRGLEVTPERLRLRADGDGRTAGLY